VIESIENQVKRSILNHKPGKIFFPSNFLKFGSSTAIRKSLNRLKDEGILIQLAHGIYLYPKKNPLIGVLYPSIDEIAIAIAKRDRARIIPTGAFALNKLGLSTQIPMNIVYLTDGSPRSIKINNGSIKFKKASPKLLSVKSDKIILLIQAIKELGENNIDFQVKKLIKNLMITVDIDLQSHDLKLAPQWIRKVIKSSIEE
jgi:hypothetical protein